MKKYLVSIVLCVIVGVIMGKIMFDQYGEKNAKKVSVNNVSADVYFFQVGVFSNLENLNNAKKNYSNSVYMKQEDKYYLFIGITKNEENKEKLKQYFNQLKIDIYIKKINITDSGFLENLEQYDILLKAANTDEEIKNINNTILSKYEELMSNG